MPLLALSTLRIDRADLRFAVRLVHLLALLGFILCVLWLTGWGHTFQSEVDPMTGDRATSIYFIGLLTSHTGAGAFWATVSAFLLAFGASTRRLATQTLAVTAICLTLATGGRAATIGLVASAVWMLCRGDLVDRRNLLLGGSVVSVGIAGSLCVAFLIPDIRDRMAEMASRRSIAAVRATWREPVLENASGYFYSGARLEHHNLVVRVFLWKYALQLARTSPFVGVGFGRFNDSYPRFEQVAPAVRLITDGQRNYGSGIQWEREQMMVSTGNAHNSYLHLLAETGILGLLIFAGLWWRVASACSQRECPLLPDETDKQSIRHVSQLISRHGNRDGKQFDRGFRIGCQAMIVCLAVAAMAGHALCAPTGGILATTLIGAHLASRSLSMEGKLCLAPQQR